MEDTHNLLSDEQIIRQNQKYFNWYLYLPALATMVLGALTFVFALISSFEYSTGISLVILLGGALGCIITYFIMKISLSYKILHIYYLKSISEQLKRKEN